LKYVFFPTWDELPAQMVQEDFTNSPNFNMKKLNITEWENKMQARIHISIETFYQTL
jgi:hypothetical protein